ncbi:MAG: hypothetical protein SFX72_11465 [Isosphaeraceae bacterium]|nr:hypothetical protein [Isosphaeraceae bacterium]
MKTEKSADRVPQREAGLPPWVRGSISAALAFHAVAILGGVFAAPPASDLQRAWAEAFAGYHGLIDQGYSYRYFAPEPPPTPVITARLFDAEGREIRTVRIPERGLTPRMRYQRQLSIANALASSLEQSRRNPDRPPPFWAKSFAERIGREEPRCRKVRLALQLHLIPELDAIRRDLISGAKPPELDDPRFYTVPESIGEFACDPSAS